MTNKASSTKVREIFRNKFVEDLQQAINNNNYNWRTPWKTNLVAQYNPITKRRYHGINVLVLGLFAQERGYSDPRWLTYKQIHDNGWQFKGDVRGQGVPVEYWFSKTYKNQSADTPENENDEDNSVTRWYPKNYWVFNASLVDGIPPLEVNNIVEDPTIKSNVFLDSVVANSGVTLEYKDLNRAYYMPSLDTIVLPPISFFESQTAYNCTLAHELSHSTGGPSRLNRDLSGGFGTEQYAIEELIAEFSAIFLNLEIDMGFDDDYLEQNMAYLKCWLKLIQDKPNILDYAIKQGEKSADFLFKLAGLELQNITGIDLSDSNDAELEC